MQYYASMTSVDVGDWDNWGLLYLNVSGEMITSCWGDATLSLPSTLRLSSSEPSQDAAGVLLTQNSNNDNSRRSEAREVEVNKHYGWVVIPMRRPLTNERKSPSV